ncbi:YncE family protein [Maribacter sp. IgM3_T14_3]|uniref:YncE family protein n=1 Tax=Maribacter sp. IgM3_T14_3 TaxID=3415140 RepID=UPI003C6FDC65
MKTITLKNKVFSKNNRQRLLGLMAVITLMGCNKDDGVENQAIPEITVYGKWEVTSGQFAIDNSKFVYINEDNTIDILAEDDLGFKRYVTTNISVSENQITVSGGEVGSSINNYSIEDDRLTIIPPNGTTPIRLERKANDNEASNWIKSIAIINEGEVTWRRDIDIAFDGTYILGYEEADRNILKINPVDFSVAETIPTINSAYAVEIEKSDTPQRQLFQSDNGNNKFKSYIYSSNNLYYTSIELGAWIGGIASVQPGYLWAASSNNRSLYYYKSNGALTPGEVLETIPLDFQPEGLDYQDGFLYVTERNRIHKCQTSPDFKAIETYEISDNNVYGIAYDGVHFWLSAQAWGEDGYKLTKVEFPQ